MRAFYQRDRSYYGRTAHGRCSYLFGFLHCRISKRSWWKDFQLRGNPCNGISSLSTNKNVTNNDKSMITNWKISHRQFFSFPMMWQSLFLKYLNNVSMNCFFKFHAIFNISICLQASFCQWDFPTITSLCLFNLLYIDMIENNIKIDRYIYFVFIRKWNIFFIICIFFRK